jgi:hypothetical protein
VIIPRDTLVTIDAHCVVAAVLANSTSFINAMDVNAGAIGSHLFIINALVCVPVALAS